MKGSFPEVYTPPKGSAPLWSSYVTRMKWGPRLVTPLSRLPGGSLPLWERTVPCGRCLPPWVKPPSPRGGGEVKDVGDGKNSEAVLMCAHTHRGVHHAQLTLITSSERPLLNHPFSVRNQFGRR